MDGESPRIEKYFGKITERIDAAYKVANKARAMGFDPEDKVAIPVVSNMAERVEGLISVVAPQIRGSGLSDRIKELEGKYGALDWRISLVIAEELANGKFCEFKDKKEAMEIGIRAGFAYHTMGVVASPLEGFVDLRMKRTRDGKEYFAVAYAGPIRSAGGTGASVSVLIVDYIRIKMGYAAYDPTEDEINRMVTELYDYHERITNLQYLPSEEEIKFLVKHLPVQIDGDPSEKIEVSNYKDLDRIETNTIRNGVCLVLGEGIAQKAPKLWKQISKWGDEFGLGHWKFLGEFVDLQKKIKAKGDVGGDGEKPKVTADHTFIKDLVAGRPVFTYPMRHGGFRLRYGRSRTSGFSSDSIHPATTYILNRYIATGTQLKVERPGKAASITTCDTIEGPIVKLENGDVVRVNSVQKAKELADHVEEIIYLGDILINYGDFLNRAHVLVPPGYNEEWWVQELEKAIVDNFGSLDSDKAALQAGVDKEKIDHLLKDPLNTPLPARVAIDISSKLNVPLHPKYTYFWDGITIDEFKKLITWFERADVVKENDAIKKVILPMNEAKRSLELIGIPHKVVNKEFIVLPKENATAFLHSIGYKQGKEIKGKDMVEVVNNLSGIMIRDKSGLFIGARMGRPEKAKMRKLTGSPQVLFPVGDEGGRLRCFQSALEAGKINGDFPINYCAKCKKETIYRVCQDCGKKADKMRFCATCGMTAKEECEHGKTATYRRREIDVKNYFNSAMTKLKMRAWPDLIKGVRGTSNKEHTPEHLIKGILRAKHDIYVNKDGTTRYDMTQLAITHFKPKEIGTSVEKLIECGYEKDVYGKKLEKDDQIVEILPQDIILPACDQSPDEGADDVLFRVANFIDELLVKMYGLKPYYNLESMKDLVGRLVLCLAPHTSSAITARIIGFSKTQGFLAHPLIHAATRRDCDGDEACVTLLMDALLNFSRQFLPAHRGSTQDAPLVLTSKLVPTEVDDMVFDIDTASKYPLEFYNACLEYKHPWEVKIETISDRLGKDSQYEGMMFTHDTTDFNMGARCSSYKTLPSMEEKLKGQMQLAVIIRAVNPGDVAGLVIEKHFIKDTKGNLRKFSMQQFRCVKCNEKFRRPPLIGICTKCKGKIIFTISEGSVVKYLEPSISLAENYNVPEYLKHSLTLLKRRVEGVFGRDKERQEGLGKWFG